MRLNLRVSYADESVAEVVASAPDLVAFEQRWDRSVARFGDDFRLTDMCWLAWHALKRKGETALEFEPWLESIDSVTVGGAAPIAPLETSQPTG